MQHLARASQVDDAVTGKQTGKALGDVSSDDFDFSFSNVAAPKGMSDPDTLKTVDVTS